MQTIKNVLSINSQLSDLEPRGIKKTIYFGSTKEGREERIRNWNKTWEHIYSEVRKDYDKLRSSKKVSS